MGPLASLPAREPAQSFSVWRANAVESRTFSSSAAIIASIGEPETCGSGSLRARDKSRASKRATSSASRSAEARPVGVVLVRHLERVARDHLEAHRQIGPGLLQHLDHPRERADPRAERDLGQLEAALVGAHGHVLEVRRDGVGRERRDRLERVLEERDVVAEVDAGAEPGAVDRADQRDELLGPPVLVVLDPDGQPLPLEQALRRAAASCASGRRTPATPRGS